MSSQFQTVTDELSEIVRSEGFARFGFAELTKPVSIEIYSAWIDKGFHGEMAYLERHEPEKRSPQKLLPRACSAVVVAVDYVPHPAPSPTFPLKGGARVATYARGQDYHHFLKAGLARVIERLKARWPNDVFASFTDSSPVLERDLAVRAGLGWIGKNTCLLSRNDGSLCFIGEIYTSLALPTAKLNDQDFCGNCTRCLDACPTGALIAPRELDARLCISYLTIESRSLPPEPLRKKIGDWFFGCDVCQTVCPWNQKVFGATVMNQISAMPARELLIADLKFIFATPKRALEREFKGTPLARAGGTGLKRNALIVAANHRTIELQTEIEVLATDPKLKDLAEWALNCLSEGSPPQSNR